MLGVLPLHPLPLHRLLVCIIHIGVSCCQQLLGEFLAGGEVVGGEGHLIGE
jgi:hypothetical protein